MAEQLKQFAKYQNLLSFVVHPTIKKYLFSTAQIRGIIKGNQGGGTATTIYDAVLRLLGIHPVKERNILN